MTGKTEICINFKGEPVAGVFLERLNRFAAMVEIEGVARRVFVPNSGRMKELLVPGVRVYLQYYPLAHRVTQYDLVMVEHGPNLVCIDSRMPNRLLEKALKAGAIQGFEGFSGFKREAAMGSSRLDFMLEYGDQKVYIEAKSVTLVVDGEARFPDAPTPRGARHLKELTHQAQAGERAGVLFLVQRNDARQFASNDGTDPEFGRTLREAARAGVEIQAWICRVEPGLVCLDSRIPVRLD
ncbi:MAG: DNA/RNA nuclease SfsA [Clostridia bacterium]|nr:DNA/RNA nuclease SfsA [Clostridia bacterium]